MTFLPIAGILVSVPANPTFADLRRDMVETQLRGRGIEDPRVLGAMARVPREHFVPHEVAHLAYADHPVAIAGGQTISQPYVVALTMQAARIADDEIVLDVGAGTGYSSAVASLLARSVFAIESDAALAVAAAERLGRLGFTNVRVAAGDGTRGWPEHGPYRAIVAAAAAAEVPSAWIAQLANGGRIVAPVGTPDSQHLLRLTKSAMGIVREKLLAVRYVPLVPRAGPDDVVELP